MRQAGEALGINGNLKVGSMTEEVMLPDMAKTMFEAAIGIVRDAAGAEKEVEVGFTVAEDSMKIEFTAQKNGRGILPGPQFHVLRVYVEEVMKGIMSHDSEGRIRLTLQVPVAVRTAQAERGGQRAGNVAPS